MKLLDLHISGFGKFHDRDISFEDGLNIIYGRNETGKSTLHTFIRCMLFGLERGRGRAAKNDLYSKYEPWENKAVYGGRLRLEQDGTIYRIERNFQKDQKFFVIVNETLGREVPPTRVFLDQLFCGLNEISYNNTISIGQLKSATDGGMVAELRNYIANMNTSGNMALNITKATSYLKSRRKEFERQLDPDAARNYTSLVSEIRAIEKEISAPEYENHLQAYQNMRLQLRSLRSEKQREKEALLQKIAKGRQVLAGAQFTDEASIISYQEDAQNTYDSYLATKTASEKKSRTVLAVLCLILAAGCAGFAGYMGILGNTSGSADFFIPGVSPLALLIAAIAGMSATAILGIVMLLHGKSLKKETAMSAKILQEIFSRHLGDSTISGEAMQALQSRMEEFRRLSQILTESENSVEEQTAALSALQERENTCDDAISLQQKTQWELEKKLDHLARCKDQIEALKQTLTENERIREEITAIDLALETMTELSATIRDSFGLYLNKTASDLIAGITGGIYSSMSVDENLNIFMNTRTKLVPIDQVSSGTMDQIYLALRLAAAKLIQSGHDQMPLIFDDSFVLYDDERLRTALKWVGKAFGDRQIIIFTCHQREEEILRAEKIAFNLITM